MPGPAYKFVFLDGELEVRRASDIENHYALVYEMAGDRGVHIEAIERLGIGDLYPDGEELEVLFFRRVEADEELRVEVEAALERWAGEHGHKLSYPPELQSWDIP